MNETIKKTNEFFELIDKKLESVKEEDKKLEFAKEEAKKVGIMFVIIILIELLSITYTIAKIRK